MADPQRAPLTVEACRAKADECREMALRALTSEHRIMLDHMAETWERIANDVKTTETH